MAHAVRVVLHMVQEALVFEVAQDGSARFLVGHARVGASLVVHAGLAVHRDDDFEVVALADLPVVRVVAGSHLHCAGAELRLHHLVGHDGDFPADDGQQEHAADLLLVPLVARVHCHAGVGHHRLRPRCRYHHEGGERHAPFTQ